MSATISQRSVKAGIIGLGVGESHLHSYQGLPDVEVAAVCDLDGDKARQVATKYDVPNFHTEYRRITEDPDIDVVSICSYDDVHAEQAVSAFRHDKHVMVEKPVALFRDEAEAVLRAQQDSGKFITSNLILRESPRFIEVRNQIAAGEFGEIVTIEGDYIHDILWKIVTGWRGQMSYYCTIYGGGIHLIDLMRWLIGQEVVEVCGMSNKINTRGTGYKFDDVFLNLLRFDGGTLGKTMSTYGPQRTKFHSLNVYGTKQTFINDIPNAKLFDGDQPENETAVTTPYPGMQKGDLIPEFIKAVQAGHEPNVSARDVFRVMDICFAAQESAELGRTISVSYQL